MKTTHILTSGLAAFALTACGGASTQAEVTPAGDTAAVSDKLQDVSAANYSLETNHAFLSFEVGHSNDISSYRVRFTDVAASLDFDPAAPEAAKLSVAINPLGVETSYPGDYKTSHPDTAYESWNEDLARDAKWLSGDLHPEITFTSTNVQLTGADTGNITGDLFFLGQTKPVTLAVTLNGATNVPWFGERDLIGFDASTTLVRSEWGMDAYLPLVGDKVVVEFSGEFLQDE